MRFAPGLKMDARSLRRSVVLRLRTGETPRMLSGGVPETGTGEPVFTDVRVRAKRAQIPGTEEVVAGRFQGTDRARWITPFDPRVNTETRLLDDEGKTWNITHVGQIGERSFCDLACVRGEQLP